VTLLKAYADGIPEGDGISAGGSENAGRKSAAFYWIGECLYSLGLLDKAGEVFSVIIEQYPQSAKYEAASYRIALINQKKIESELLDLLKWSHEESLKTMEEYQRRERSYDQALVAYQKRIADILKDTRLADLENANALYKKQLSEAETRIAALEENLREANTAMNALREANGAPVVSPPAVTSSEKTIRLLSFKTMALELTNELMRRLNEYENSASRETGR
jgi:tetratricopeptide (TPR) repeat protein